MELFCPKNIQWLLAHEFLCYVIDACLKTCPRLKKLGRNGGNGSGSTSVVKEIFGGALQSQVKCLSYGIESNKVDERMDISLDIFIVILLKMPCKGSSSMREVYPPVPVFLYIDTHALMYIYILPFIFLFVLISN